MERAVALSDKARIEPEHLPSKLRQATHRVISTPAQVDCASLPSLCQVEEHYIRHVLEQSHHNKSKAAQILGIDRRTLHRKLRSMREREEPPPSGRRVVR